MKLRQYRFKFYLNAMHAFKFENKIGNIHPHTWEIIILVTNTTNELVQFSQIENKINNFLDNYEGKVLNVFSPFDVVQPTMENLSSFFSDHIIKLLNNSCWRLDEFLISENPARQFIKTFNENEKTGKIKNINLIDKEKDFKEGNATNVLTEEDIKKQQKEQIYMEKREKTITTLKNRLNYLQKNIVTIASAIYSRHQKILISTTRVVFTLISILILIMFIKSSTIDYKSMFENSIFYKLWGGSL